VQNRKDTIKFFELLINPDSQRYDTYHTAFIAYLYNLVLVDCIDGERKRAQYTPKVSGEIYAFSTDNIHIPSYLFRTIS